MNTRELRIGNHVMVGGVETTVGHIMGDEDYFRPIQITKEWLLKFGFEKNEDHKVYLKTLNTLNGFTTLEHDGEGCIWFDNAQLQCRYVHQLQNLYYALTQKELQYEGE